VALNEVVDEGSVEDIARAEGVGGADWGDFDLKAAAMIADEYGVWAAGECDEWNAL
jgi:hypothetical protein